MQCSGFFDGAYMYGQEEFSRYYENLYRDGVSYDDNLHLTLGVKENGEKVTVSKGFSIIKGYYLYNEGDLSINIKRPTVDRIINRVVITLDKTEGSSFMKIQLKEGTYEAAPTLIREGNVYELSLAKVIVPKQGKIQVIDERTDETLCGGIRPRTFINYENEVKKYNDMITKLNQDFNSWINRVQNKSREIYIQDTKPNESVSGSIWIDTSVV